MGHRKEEWRQPGEPALCPGCRCSLPADAFYRNVSRPSGLSSYCRACTDERNLPSRDWRRVRNLERRLNPEERKAKKKAAQWGRHRLWRRANAEHVRAVARMRARSTRQKIGRCTPEQERDRWAYYGGLCWMCGGLAVEMDHVIPISKGGLNWPANLRPSCRRCNMAKRDNWPWGPPKNAVLAWANTSTTPTTG